MSLKRFFGLRFVIGLVFLFNPIISLFDVLPDFIGWLLLFSALTEAAFLDGRLAQARSLTLYGAALSAARTVLMFFVFDMDDSWILSVVSLLGAAELFVAIYFAASFFGGITYLAERCESDNVLGGVDGAKHLWIGFWIVHTAATILPETAALPLLTIQHDPYAYPNTDGRTILLYKNGAMFILCAISLIMGIWWLVRTARFMKGVRKDERFKATLGARYDGFLKQNPLQETYLAVRMAAVLLTAGFALQMNFALDNIYVVPAWAGTVLLALCLYRLGVRKTKGFFGYPALCAAFAVQVACVCIPAEGVWRFVCPPLLAAACFVAVFVTQRLFSANVTSRLDYDIEGGFMLADIPLAVFLVCRAVYDMFSTTVIKVQTEGGDVNIAGSVSSPVYWFHFASIAAFIAWIVFIIKLSSDLIGVIKLKRRL